jgi:predicted CopG family antitoxin
MCITLITYHMSHSKYVNIVIDKNNYDDLKALGEVPESFNDVIGRLLKDKQLIIKAIRAAKEKQEE